MTMRGWLALGTVAVELVARGAGAAAPIDPATLKMKIRLPGKIAKTTIPLAKQ
jgi:hypothetical protein